MPKRKTVKLPSTTGTATPARSARPSDDVDLASDITQARESEADDDDDDQDATGSIESSGGNLHGEIVLRLPIAITDDYIPHRVSTDVRNITPKQRKGLNLLLQGLKMQGDELSGGQRVNNYVNSIRFLLESIADAADVVMAEID